jgi:hypothetical protein
MLTDSAGRLLLLRFQSRRGSARDPIANRGPRQRLGKRDPLVNSDGDCVAVVGPDRVEPGGGLVDELGSDGFGVVGCLLVEQRGVLAHRFAVRIAGSLDVHGVLTQGVETLEGLAAVDDV